MEKFSYHHHHNNYVPSRPSISDDHRNPYLRHHHHLPPPPLLQQLPPPPSYAPLPPAPPPPPPFNPQQSQFTFLNHHREPPIRDFTLTHTNNHHHLHSPPLPRVSTRTLFESDHSLNRIRESNRPYPHRPDSWVDPPRVPPNHHDQPISPYRPTNNYNHDLDRERKYGYRDEPVDGYRGNLQNQQLLRDQNDRHKRGRDHEVGVALDNYHQDNRSLQYLPNSGRSRDFDSYNGPSSSISRDLPPSVKRTVGNQETYVPLVNEERLRSSGDEDWTWLHIDSPVGKENHEFETTMKIPSVSTRRLSNVNNRTRAGREEFIGTQKKQMQKKSAFLRISKPNHKNKSKDHFSKSHFDDFNTSTFRGKDKDPVEEQTVGSPVELDISFKSNSLVAKAIMNPSSPSVVANRNLSPSNKSLEKADGSPKTKFVRRLIKLDRSTYGSDSPSSSDKGPKQSPEKVSVSGNVSLYDIGSSLPSSSGTDDSAGSTNFEIDPINSQSEIGIPQTNTEEPRIDESTTSNFEINPTNSQGIGMVSNDCLVDDSNNMSCLDRPALLLEADLVEVPPITKVFSDEDAPMAEKQGKITDTEMGFSSPRASETLVNVVSNSQGIGMVSNDFLVDDSNNMSCVCRPALLLEADLVEVPPITKVFSDEDEPMAENPRKITDTEMGFSSPCTSETPVNVVTNSQGIDMVSNDCLVDDSNNVSCLDRPALLLEADLDEVPPITKVFSDEDVPMAEKKRKITDTEMGFSSTCASETPVNVVSSVLDGEITTCSPSVKDFVSTEEEVSESGLVNIGSKTCNNDGGVSTGNVELEGSTKDDLLFRGGISGGLDVISPMSKKKRKLCHNFEKHVSDDKETLDNSKVHIKSDPAKVDDILVNSTPNKGIQSLSSTKGESSLLRRNLPNSAVPRVFTGRSSLVFSRKAKLTNHSAKPRTWHRTDNPSVSLPTKKPYSVPAPPSKLSPIKFGKIQSPSYIRKGHSLVRKPTLATALSKDSSRASSSSVYRLNPSSAGETKKSSISESKDDGTNSASFLITGGQNAPLERPKTPSLPCSTKSLDCTTVNTADFIVLPLANPPANGGSETTSDSLEYRENVDPPKSSEEANATDSINTGCQSVTNEVGKIRYVKRKANQLVAASNNGDLAVEDVDKTQAKSSEGYYKRRKNQIVRTLMDSQIMQGVGATSNSECQWAPKFIPSRSTSKKQLGKGSTKVYKLSKYSPVWRLSNTQSLRRDINSSQRQKVWPNLFPWKRASYWKSFMQKSPPVSIDSSLSTISQKLLLSRKRDTIYTRSTHGFSLRISKLLSVGGSSLKWSKSIERNSKKANEEATLAVAAAEKKKRERNGAARKSVHSIKPRPGARIYRIGAVRYKMDPTKRTLQRISDEKQSSSSSLQSEKDSKKPYVPRRLVIGNDEYVRLGNGNQLIRDPKKRTRTLASEKVRWSLHTARLRLARKNKYCQFFTRFGRCNKDDGKCPYIHDLSKIAVCTKFLNDSCSNPNCKLTHEVIPERMQDCSYFLQGLCSNENCPYRHVNVNPNASVCEGFLKGYCSDGNECRKKHTYVCPIFEATGKCSEGSKCKLHHPKTKTKSTKKKQLVDNKNARGRYFAEQRRTEGHENHHHRYSKKKEEDIFYQEGKFADYVILDVSDDEEEDIGMRIEERSTCNNITSLDLEEGGIDELIKPIRLMLKDLTTETSPAVESTSVNYLSEESNRC